MAWSHLNALLSLHLSCPPSPPLHPFPLANTSDHWRKNTPVLGQRFRAYSIDLLGYGFSDKPNPREAEPNSIYNFENWGQQLTDFIDEVIGEPTYISTNSVGGASIKCCSAYSSLCVCMYVFVCPHASSCTFHPHVPGTLPRSHRSHTYLRMRRNRLHSYLPVSPPIKPHTGLAGLCAGISRPELVRGVQLINISLRGLHVERQQPWQRPLVAAFQRLLK